MLATDPLSLVFIACALFSGVFLLISSVLGAGHGHAADAGHAGHVGHVGHLAHGGLDISHDAGHVAQHVAHAQADLSHAAHAAHASHQAGAASGEQAPALWGTLNSLLLGAINLYGLLMFLLVFGLVGYVLHGILGWDAPALVAAAGVAMFCAVALSAVFARLFATPAGTMLTADDARLQGRLGTVSMDIRPGGIGEIIFTRPEGGRQSIGARSESGTPLPTGTEVVIIDYQDGVATVETWDGFIAGVRLGTVQMPPPLNHDSSHP